MLTWSIREIELPLKFVWKIARGSVTTKTNYIVEVFGGDMSAAGEVSICTRFGETPEQIHEGFSKFTSSLPGQVRSVEELIDFLNDLELPGSLRFGIESAFVSYLAQLSEKPVEELLGQKSVNVLETSISLPIMPIGDIKKFIDDYDLTRFKTMKVKVGRDSDPDFIKEVLKHFFGKICIDANESFNNPDEVLQFLERQDLEKILFLEQPMHADLHDDYLYLKENSPVYLIADESITTQNVTEYYVRRFHGINIKMMKSGGYLKAISQLRKARELGLKTMLGCMLETSLGISSAFNLAYKVDFIDLDSHLFLKNEPFNLLTEENGRLFRNHLQ